MDELAARRWPRRYVAQPTPAARRRPITTAPVATAPTAPRPPRLRRRLRLRAVRALRRHGRASAEREQPAAGEPAHAGRGERQRQAPSSRTRPWTACTCACSRSTDADGGAVQVARPLTRGRPRAAAAAHRAARGGPRRHRGGRVDRAARRARGARAGVALHAPHRGAHRRPGPLGRGSRSRATTSSARLARSFNATLDALERSVEAQRHLVADASHELRTPIASLRANIQMLSDAERLPADERDSLRADIIEELDALTALVADVVDLARGSEPREGADDVALDQIVEQRAGGRAPARARPALRGAARAHARARRARTGSPARWPTCSTTPSSGAEPEGRVEVALSERRAVVRDHGPGFDEAGPPPRLRPLLPRRRGAPAARLRPRPRDRPPDRRGPRRLGRGPATPTAVAHSSRSTSASRWRAAVER